MASLLFFAAQVCITIYVGVVATTPGEWWIFAACVLFDLAHLWHLVSGRQ